MREHFLAEARQAHPDPLQDAFAEPGPQKQLPRQFALAGQQWGWAVGFRRMPNGAQLFISERLHARIVFTKSDIFQKAEIPYQLRKTHYFQASALLRLVTSCIR
jgi:hypothetical protein